MHFQWITIPFLLSLISFVRADVDITSPSEGDSFSASGGTVSVKIKWKDSSSDDDDDISLSNLKTMTISLCYGSSSDVSCADPIVDAKKITDTSYTASIDSSDYPDGYYFFQFYNVYDDSSTTIVYSDRFQLKDMDGSSKSITATASGDSPAGQTSLDAAATSINSKSFSITYTLQTGTKRYAPMQQQPGTTVTATTWSRRFPTSSYTPYSTLHKSPNVYSTVTPGWSYTPKSATNTAETAAYPTYFYAASSRVSKATLSSATKRRRWLD